MEHADLDARIDGATRIPPVDELAMRRMKKRRLALLDEMQRIRDHLLPDAPA